MDNASIQFVLRYLVWCGCRVVFCTISALVCTVDEASVWMRN